MKFLFERDFSCNLREAEHFLILIAQTDLGLLKQQLLLLKVHQQTHFAVQIFELDSRILNPSSTKVTWFRSANWKSLAKRWLAWKRSVSSARVTVSTVRLPFPSTEKTARSALWSTIAKSTRRRDTNLFPCQTCSTCCNRCMGRRASRNSTWISATTRFCSTNSLFRTLPSRFAEEPTSTSACLSGWRTLRTPSRMSWRRFSERSTLCSSI